MPARLAEEVAQRSCQSGELFGLAQHLPRVLKIITVFGGVSINPQMMNLRGGADIVVATPGRMLDHQSQGTLNLSGIDKLRTGLSGLKEAKLNVYLSKIGGSQADKKAFIWK